jgi:aspartyl-tRNA(Asn)/glutamyl-tRNA(Gln) amidotransferase subunit A
MPPDVSDIRIGIPEQLLWTDCASGIAEKAKDALDELAHAGARLVPIKFSEATEAWAEFQQGGIIATELFTFLKDNLPEYISDLDPLIAPRVLAAQDFPAATFLSRQWRLERLAKSAQEQFGAVDVIACPTVAIPPPTLEEIATYNDYLSAILPVCAIHRW